jgi:hypothetical protein
MNWEDDDDFDFNDDMSEEDSKEFEREQKQERKRLKNHPLFIQANELLDIVSAIVESIPEEGKEIYGNTLMESAMIIPAKIAGAMSSGSWLLSMQNAALIRHHAEYLLVSTNGLKIFTKTHADHIKLLREEMIRFRELFNDWAKEIHAMPEEEFVDDWGLFIRSAI